MFSLKQRLFFLIQRLFSLLQRLFSLKQRLFTLLHRLFFSIQRLFSLKPSNYPITTIVKTELTAFENNYYICLAYISFYSTKPN